MSIASNSALISDQDSKLPGPYRFRRSLASSYPWLIVTGCLLLIAWAFFVQSAAQSFIEMGPAALAYWRFLLVEPFGWLLWLLLLPLILLTCQYFPLTGSNKWKISLPVQGFAAILFSICHLYLHLICEALVLDSWPLSFYSVELKLNFFTFLQLTGQVLSYSIIVVLVTGVNHYRKYQKLELEAAELERLIKEDTLENMMVELGPEFLMGTFRSIYEKIDPRTIQVGLQLILVARHIERIADHATNIAEDVVYMVEAKDIRHHAEEASPKG